MTTAAERLHADTIYVGTTDSSGGVIYQTDVATGQTSTFIRGTGPSGNNIYYPTALTIGPDGDVYVGNGSEEGYIVKVTPSGQPTTVASNGYMASGLAFDQTDNLYISEFQDGVEKLTPGGTSSEFASGLEHPTLEAFDPAGNLYVATNETESGSTIVRITPSGAESTFATNAAGVFWDNSGNLYTGYGNGTITLTTPSGSTSTFATGFTYPIPIGISSADDLYVWDAGDNGVVDSVTPGGAVSEIASAPGAFAVTVATPEPSGLFLVAGLTAVIFGRRRQGKG